MEGNISTTGAEDERYARKKAFYQSERIVSNYDRKRWSSFSRRQSNKRKFMAISKAISRATALGRPIRTALDIPCGTGRIFPLLASLNITVTEADLSNEMLNAARKKIGESQFILEYIQSSAESMPFPDNHFDAVFSIRFFFHLSQEVRRRAVKEMARVSRQWVILDYRHRYTLKYLLKQLKIRLGISSRQFNRVSKRDIEDDFKEAGLEVIGIFPTSPSFSDKWIVLGRKKI